MKDQNLEAPPSNLYLVRLSAFKLSLLGIKLEKHNGHRRRKRLFCNGRRQFTSYSKIPGAKKMSGFILAATVLKTKVIRKPNQQV
ncbi:MAG TPA: hypothetical protein VK465_07890 [Fibrobacteria bacterium]|nr:hypothetical protein [Fibrobacteria bacterium]